MHGEYRYELKRGGEVKVVIATTYSIFRANEMVAEEYPGWEVSNFRMVWP
jgi:hypothetical protein